MAQNSQKTVQRRRRWRWLRTVTLLLVILSVTTVLLRTRSRHPAPSPRREIAGPPLPAPEFSLPGAVYTSNISVRLAANSPSTVIRYTLNASEPAPDSPKYSRPIKIASCTLLRAQLFDESGAARSPVASQAYIIAGTDLAVFSSNLPLVVLNSFGQDIGHDKKVHAFAHFIDAAGGHSTLNAPADYHGWGDLNIRGHSSMRYPKRSYHLKTRDDAQNPLKVSLLGLPKESDWVLYAPYPDKTLMRDVLGYELSNQIGRYAPRTKFVEVFLNQSGGKLSQRDYLGVYILEERIKRGKHRVQIEKLAPEDNSEPNVTGGYIFKKDHLDSPEIGVGNPAGLPMGGPGRNSSRDTFSSGPGGFPGSPDGFRPTEGRPHSDRVGFFQRLSDRFSSGRQWFLTGHGNQFLYVEPKADEITSQQRDWLIAYVNKFEGVLYGADFKDPKTGYAAYIDADSFIDHHLLVEVTKNIDGFRFSTFYYKDRGDKIKMGPIWDWNLSFGNANGKQGWIPEYWYWPQLDDQQYSWFRRLFEDPDFAQR